MLLLHLEQGSTLSICLSLSARTRKMNRPDDDFFQAPQVPVQILLMVSQIQQRIGHKLTRGVARHLPTPFCSEQGRGGVCWVKSQVAQSAAASQGEDGWVLQEKYCICSAAICCLMIT